jgi:hypothetical protein
LRLSVVFLLPLKQKPGTIASFQILPNSSFICLVFVVCQCGRLCRVDWWNDTRTVTWKDHGRKRLWPEVLTRQFPIGSGEKSRNISVTMDSTVFPGRDSNPALPEHKPRALQLGPISSVCVYRSMLYSPVTGVFVRHNKKKGKLAFIEITAPVPNSASHFFFISFRILPSIYTEWTTRTVYKKRKRCNRKQLNTEIRHAYNASYFIFPPPLPILVQFLLFKLPFVLVYYIRNYLPIHVHVLHSSSSSVVVTRLSGPRSRPPTCQKIW